LRQPVQSRGLDRYPGRRRLFLHRMVQFADMIGKPIPLLY
jgi:hypothetical protein